ncbi:MAG: GxxExxY protein, partial [Holophaga sp.]|nr:GxxExxY protein [Holophaga sp.]
NELGNGFIEKVYENALAHELRKAKVKVVQQQGIEVFYDGVNVWNYEAEKARIQVRRLGMTRGPAGGEVELEVKDVQ